MLVAAVPIVVGHLIGLIGVIGAVRRRWLKWLLAALIGVACVISVINALSQEKQRQEAERDSQAIMERLDTVLARLLALQSRIAEMERAASAPGQERIRSIGRNARIDMARAMLKVVDEQNLLPKTRIRELEGRLRRGPLEPSDLDMVRAGIMRWHRPSPP